jgi:predicted Zn-dependent protease
VGIRVGPYDEASDPEYGRALQRHEANEAMARMMDVLQRRYAGARPEMTPTAPTGASRLQALVELLRANRSPPKGPAGVNPS